MASDWEIVKLSDFVDIKTGFPFKSKQYLEHGEGYKLLRGDNVVQGAFRWANVKLWSKDELTEKQKGYFLEEGDVILAMDRPWIEAGLKTAQITNKDLPCLLVQRVARLQAKNSEDQDFLRYLVSSYWFVEYLKLVQTGTAIPHISTKQILSYETKIPPLIERKNIGRLLRSLDDKIELNRQMNETLEAMAQALFKSWFVDFDPVIDNALVAGNAIPDELLERAEQRKGIEKKDNSEIQDLFPDAFEFTEEMGWIPKGWDVENLDKKIDVLNGFAFKSKDYVEKGLFVLRTKNFTSERSIEILGDDVYLPNEFENTFSKYLSEPFDYHLVMVGASVGNRGLIEPHQLPALRNQNMWCFRPKPNSQISRSYVKYMLDFVTPQKLGLASGSAREFFRKGDFQKHQLCLPSNATLNRFDQIAFSYLKKKAQNNSENVSLSKLRDTLLPKLMSGELRIPDDVF